ncbi:MAG: DUF1217 domain-containing protein [Dongiaceae bacterium]
MIGSVAGAASSSAVQGYRLIEKTLDRQMESFEKSPTVKREIDYVRDRLKTIDSAEELVGDYRVMRFVMSAFGLDSQVNAKALIKRVLAEGWRESGAMANKLVDPRYREMARAFDFKESGSTIVKSKALADSLVDRFVTNEFEKSAGEGNPAVRYALYFKRKAASITSWYQVLGDRPLFEVVRTVLGVQTLGPATDLDRQVKFLETRIGLDNLKKPDFAKRFVDRYLSAYDQRNSTATLSGAAQILAIGTNSLNAGGTGFAAQTTFALLGIR